MESFIAVVVSQQNPSPDLVFYMLDHCPNPELKYKVSKDLKLYRLTIAALIELRERQLLADLRQTIIDNYSGSDADELKLIIDNALYKSKIKWKT
jgi:hypothetical protein